MNGCCNGRLLFLLILSSAFVAAESSALMSFSRMAMKLVNVFAREKDIPITDPEAYMTVPEMILFYGYPVQIHRVVTKDGYILELHRLPHGRNGVGGPRRRTPVLLMHGVLFSSAQWVLNRGNNSLATILADAGFDVWLGNFRGTSYSKRHVRLSTDKPEFWDFSWWEMGAMDLPAIVDYVLLQTKEPKINYIGYSEGALTMFQLLSIRPEYNNKIRNFFALAPCVFMGGSRSPYKYLIPFKFLLRVFFTNMGIYEAFPRGFFYRLFTTKSGRIGQLNTASTLVSFLTGFNNHDLDQERRPVYFSHLTDGTSVKNVEHFAQMVRSGKFARFDYGRRKNKEVYGKPYPPTLDLSRVTVPVLLFWSDNDYLVGANGFRELASKLPNVYLNNHIDYKQFTHADYFWGTRSRYLLYDQIVRLLWTLG